MEHAAVPSMSKEQTAEEWVRAYAGAILKTCFLYLADHDLAKDAMQDTFVKAWKQLQKTDPAMIRNEKAWLMKIAMNTCPYGIIMAQRESLVTQGFAPFAVANFNPFSSFERQRESVTERRHVSLVTQHFLEIFPA